MENNNLPAIVQKAIATQGIKLENVNLILPTQTFGQSMGEYDVMAFEIVEIKPADCYQITTGKNIFAKRALMSISNALGILWDPKTTTNLESSERKSRAKATGALKKPNGEWIVLTAEKTCDLDAIEEEQRLKQEEYADSGKIVKWENKYPIKEPWSKHGGEEAKQAFIDREVRKAVLPYWKFKDERAETDAKKRVIRQIIALKENYTDQELKKPFALPKIMTDVSKMLNDPRVQKIALEKMTESVTSIFGEQPDMAIPEKSEVLSDNYTVEENGDEAPTETQDTQGDELWESINKESDIKESDIDRKTREMAEDLRLRRQEYDKELPGKAKVEIDTALNTNPMNPQLISASIENLDAWESWRAGQQGGK